VQLANEGHFGSMVSYQNYKVRHVPIAEAVNRLKLVPPNGELVHTRVTSTFLSLTSLSC